MKSLNLSIKASSIVWLEWDQTDSSVNLLSLSFIEELSSVLRQIEQAQPKALVLISKKSHNFCAGADIKDIQKIQTKKEMQDVLDKVHELFFHFERLNCFKIAAIHGSCLGGGLEWALCFDYRLLTDSFHTQLGLPEVRLGLIPGFGGCLRLPRLIGLKQSLAMILTGKSLRPKQAHKIVLVDERVPPLILEKRALELAKNIVKGSPKAQEKKSYKDRKPFSFFMEKTFSFVLCFLAKRQILKKTKGFYPAPLKALEVIQKTYSSSLFQKNLEIEKKAFCEISQTLKSKNLIRVFTMIDKAKKIKPDKVSHSQKAIERVGILGAGVMGRTIAYLFADKGFKIRLVDNNEQSLCSALTWAERLWEQQRQRQKINSYELKQKMSNFSVSTNFWGFSTFDLLIEALPENKKLKQNVIKTVSKQLNSHCLFASNTSSLGISDLAESSLHPENFFGLHFFNPAYKMPLTEISLPSRQKAFPLKSIQKVLKKLGKILIFVKDSPGFVVNRLLVSYLTEALLLYEEGLDIDRIDLCYRDQFGLPLGPFQLMDKIGLDTCVEFIFYLAQAGLSFETPQWTGRLTQILGQGEKSGTGFYIYSDQKISLNKKIVGLKRARSKHLISDETIIQRGIYRMINEGKKLLEDKISKSEEDIDLALILGIGFPPFLGGPMSYAKQVGFSKIKNRLREFSSQYGPRFKPYF